MKIHIVQKGDTLWKIAKKYGVNFEELKKMNTQLSNPDMIMPGMKIKIPTSGGSIKKESHVGTNPGAGGKKEIPLSEYFKAKEKPVKEVPTKEAPIKMAPIKEAPKKEVPIKELPKKEMPMKEEPKKEAPKKEMPMKEEPKKEVPIKEMPTKEVPAKEVPKKEAPIKETPSKEAPIEKEQPILKETPKEPYTPKMPLKIAPEIDLSNYYTMNMQKMKVEQPNILPEVKDVPMKENPVPSPPPMMEAPAEMPMQEQCVPVTPVMPGPGFCPPFGGFPIEGHFSNQYGQMMPMGAGYVPGSPGGEPPLAGTQAGAPSMGGTSNQFNMDDESSTFMPQLPEMNPGYNLGAVMGAQTQDSQPAMPYIDPSTYGQIPAGYGQMPGGYGQMPGGYGQMPAGYGQMPGGYGQMPGGYGQMSEGYGQMPVGYGQMSYEYPQMMGPMGMGSTEGGMQQMMPMSQPSQGMSVGSGAGGDCGCGGRSPMETQSEPQEQNFVPPTPPIYSAPLTGFDHTIQPPFMNPYGMEPMGSGFEDESS
ncbi:SafA/ExsA family spore coat assembly protein [Neobacillus thermocopriae]|nr:SafA/ExsA family spore coat assembly protein [Neobacillus thermocopriae]MED3625590.1 SafA/ExsA family spore coat assembly protein [Neobacillus thermocopriae]